MSLTLIGAAQFIIGFILLLFGTVPSMLVFVLVSALMMGASAIDLPVIGNSSVPPVEFAAVFLAVRVLLPGSVRTADVAAALRVNLLMIVFVFYGVVGAVVLPRMFAGQIDVVPMRVRALSRYESMERFTYATQPLLPTSQNLTTAIYLVGTMMVAICAYVALVNKTAWRTLVKGIAVVGLIHVAIGFASVAAPGSEVLTFFRNGAYAQIDNSYRGFIRMNGIAPEASAYGAFAITVFIFLFECWIRDVMPRLTGAVALLLALAIACSTSSLAYLGLGSYAVMIVFRSIIFPQTMRVGRLIIICGVMLVLIVIATSLMLWQPTVANGFADMITHFTLDKSESQSSHQREFWSLIGYQSFVHSYGLGIGAGSFRSSSLIAAIMGSMGVIGIVCFTAYLIQVLKPLRLSTYVTTGDPRTSVGAAASWVCIATMVPAAVGSPTPDPGVLFALFAGVALATRPGTRRAMYRPSEAWQPIQASAGNALARQGDLPRSDVTGLSNAV